MIVCSFNVISDKFTPASGFGRDTREAMAMGSVSRMMLSRGQKVSTGIRAAAIASGTQRSFVDV